MRAARPGRGGARARLRPGQGLRPHQRRRSRHGGARPARPMPAWSWCPGTPRAVTPRAGRGDPRRGQIAGAGSSASSATRRSGASQRRGPRRSASMPSSCTATRSVGAVRALLPAETEIWAAVRVGAGSAGPRAGADRTAVRFRARGGTGRTFDWSRVAGRGGAEARPARRRPQPGQCARRRAARRLCARRRLGRRGGARAGRIRTASPPFSRRSGCRCGRAC